MDHRIEVAGLSIAGELYDFVRDEAIPGTGLDEARFWEGVAGLIDDLSPRIEAALEERRSIQEAVDAFHATGSAAHDVAAYERMLREIGYLRPEPGGFAIDPPRVDAELATLPGPQLVVPVMNARFAINAANARWGSLYDALYGTDAIERNGSFSKANYDPARGALVIKKAASFLDTHFPLVEISHAAVERYRVVNRRLVGDYSNRAVELIDDRLFVGYTGSPDSPTCVLLKHHGLHVEIRIDRAHPIGRTASAGVSDVILESAITAIMDFEDSVAAVDAADKVLGYRNWLGLMNGSLEATVTKGGKSHVRRLSPDREYTAPDGEGRVVVPGRALMLVRHVGHLMTTDALRDRQGRPIPEGILDALITGLGSLHDLRGETAGTNSREGSVYIVKPKMHGPDEVAIACELLDRAERLLGLASNTIKIGIMDEERRTSVNLKACIYEARHRVAFINTGFLDRTGDEIHTSMRAGAVVPKAAMKDQAWLRAYELRNVEIGLQCGFAGRAQIGKGMWAAPDNMAQMLTEKVNHPRAGATCAWVPSPTAATLHAIHYHQVDVVERQNELRAERRLDRLNDLLTLPLVDAASLTDRERLDELDNNVQGVLGYVVRWINAGVGCSKVPDIHGTALMEDRATCRISSQHVANWLMHGVLTRDEVEESLRRMAGVVDSQNATDSAYTPMSPTFDSQAFLAARELVLEGVAQPAGYTEPVLHRRRLKAKELNKGSVR